jgi:hypothetical protein
MNFTTKKYTRPVLRAAVKSINVRNFSDPTTLANALSPRRGRRSAQFAALRNAVGTPLASLFAGNARSNKSTILSLLSRS